MRSTEHIRFFGSLLILSEHQSGRWYLASRNPEKLAKRVGDDLFLAFMRCFAWADRVQSLWHFGYFNQRALADHSEAFTRNLQAMSWMLSSVLHEASRGIKDLADSGIIDVVTATNKHWAELGPLGHRWATDPWLIRARNDIGFHVSPKLIRRGFRDAVDDEKLFLIIGDDHTRGTTSLRLGLELLFRGTGLDLAGFNRIIETTSTDASRFGELVQLLFLDVLVARGIVPAPLDVGAP